jgi:ADP-L-glycero-D-manno-heptose 6-epimerase
MIVLTGAAGFIGSVILRYLNNLGYEDIILVDDFKNSEQYKNLLGKNYKSIITHPEELPKGTVEAIIHFGANSSTLEKDWNSIYATNILSTKKWAEIARDKHAKMIFASSAAVYGNGNGPLNLYGFSKLVSERELADMVCLRLFNVYGPNEYHKGRMSSTIYHWYNQLVESNELKIFENSKNYLRDFIWVEDVAKVVEFFLQNYRPGIYDLGSGQNTSFDTVADQLIFHMDLGKKTEIPMPTDLQNQYQINTSANLQNLVAAGFDTNSFSDTNVGIKSYLNYLKTHSYY